MRALWQRRAVRQMVFGLLPLLAIGLVTVAVLAVRLTSAYEPINRASEQTTAIVVRHGFGESGEDVELEWTDNGGARHTSTVTIDGLGDVEDGTTRTALHYDPDDPDHVVVSGDEPTTRLSSLVNGLLLTVAILVVAAATTTVRVVRRRRAERRPASRERLTVAHSRWGLVTRSWLVTETRDGKDTREWWIPVYWDRALEEIDPKKSYEVHGAPEHHPIQVADIGGTPIWPAGRRRTKPPRGQVERVGGPAPDGPRDITLTRHFRGDLGVVLAAPLLGLLWAYVDGSGAGGFGAATAVLAGVMFWVTTCYASDPT